jgi:predicted RNase H-like HicB family nuclease
MQHLSYTIVIEPDTEGFHAYVPALKGCHSCGDSPKEARKNIVEAIELYIESLRTHGEDVPIEREPIVVEQVIVDA